MRYIRDMRGFGPNPPKANWPNKAKIAIQIVLNYEEGGENCILHGDMASEAFLSEIVGAAAWPSNATGIWKAHTNTGRAQGSGDFSSFQDQNILSPPIRLARSSEQVEAMLSENREI